MLNSLLRVGNRRGISNNLGLKKKGGDKGGTCKVRGKHRSEIYDYQKRSRQPRIYSEVQKKLKRVFSSIRIKRGKGKTKGKAKESSL